MKRKFHITNIEVVLPSNKRIKVSKLTITLKNKMSATEFDDELEYLLSKERKFSNAQQPKYDNINDLEEDDQDDQSSNDHSHNQAHDTDDTITELDDDIKDDIVSLPETEFTQSTNDIMSRVTTPQPDENIFDTTKDVWCNW